jgi:Concanavalin A-like lectin/glucanases superfamily
MTIRAHFRPNLIVFGGLVLSVACSLTVPPEDELFGGGGAGSPSKAGSSSAGGPSGGSSAGTGVIPETGGQAPAIEGGQPGSAGDANGGEDSVVTPGAGGEGGEPGIVLPKAVLLLHYDFDDLSELIAEDITGNGYDGTLAGLSLPGGAEGYIEGALQLTGSQKQYVQLPNDILQGHPAVSITSWIKLGQALAWDRLFDFNSGESNWFFFSPTGWNGNTMTFGTRCATRTPSALAPEIMLTETVGINVWHHISVVFAKPFMRYYLDGVLKAELTNISFGSDELAATNQNWIGRSVYSADPYLTALVDDFRIYTGALSDEEVLELASE